MPRNYPIGPILRGHDKFPLGGTIEVARVAEVTQPVVGPHQAQVELLEAFKRDVLPHFTDTLAKEIAAVVERFGENLLANLLKVLKPGIYPDSGDNSCRTGAYSWDARFVPSAQETAQLLHLAEDSPPPSVVGLPELEEQATEIAVPASAIANVLDLIFPTD